MSKSQINIRVNDMTRRQIDRWTEDTGMSITEFITMAIDRVYLNRYGIGAMNTRPAAGPSKADVDAAIAQLKRELESPEMVRAIMGE